MTVFTIGYEGLDIGDFIALLSAHGIETVVDVRELPLSRKPGFSKKTLASVLERSGIGYVHRVALGCPKPVRDGYREDGDWKRYTARFLEYLEAQDGAVADLAGLAQSSVCALLCYEADFNFCHRAMVASAVRRHCGAEVEHIRYGRRELPLPDGLPNGPKSSGCVWRSKRRRSRPMDP